MKLIIAGGREFTDTDRVIRVLEKIQQTVGNIELVISGCARGADTCGEKAADALGIPVQRMPADWDKYGRSAGYRRNEDMAQHGTHLLAFWDGVSKGTGHMVDIARKRNLEVRVEHY